MMPGGYGAGADLAVPFFDVAVGYRRQRDEIDTAIRRVLESGWLILGPEVEAFEAELATSVGVAHAVGVASGTDAIHLALRAAGVGPGDEVLTVANAGVPPVAAIVAAGARPVFVEVDARTLLLDVAAADAAVRRQTRAIVAVHLYGQVLPLDSLRALAERHRLLLIEDCAQAQGASGIGRSGAVGCFSFYPTKNVGAAGDGGACVTDDAQLAERLRRLRNYGLGPDGNAHVSGINSRLDELQAAILRVGLRHLGQRVVERRRLAGLYDAALGECEVAPLRRDPRSDAYHLYVVRSAERESIRARLHAASIGSKVHYPIPVHHMPAFQAAAGRQPPLPISEAACREVLSLPLYPGLTDANLARVVDELM